MKKIKILIIILFIFIVALIASIYIITINNEDIVSSNLNNINNIITNEVNTDINGDINTEKEQEPLGPAEVYPIISESDYITLEKCVSTFLNTINRNNSAYYGREGQKTTTDEEVSSMILNLLSTNYIYNNKINNENINKNIYNINKGTFFIPTKIKKFYDLDRVNSFLIRGLVEDTEYNPIMEIMFILNMDTTNTTFSIEILDNKQSFDSIKPIKLDKIDKNSTNEFSYSKLTEENIINEIINLYKRTVLGYTETFYNNYLNSDYKKSKFSNLSKFKNYIEKNRELIKQINIQQYKEINDTDKKTYIIKDQYKNTYIIKYNNLIDYKMYLDYYTVELDILKEEYDKADNVTKIAIQIEKIKQMLNTKDYSAIYNKLNKTFKENNYSSESKLETYLKANTYEINTINIEDYAQQEDYYICKCTLINQKNTQETKEINIIIKLIDSNNFELSFSM